MDKWNEILPNFCPLLENKNNECFLDISITKINFKLDRMLALNLSFHIVYFMTTQEFCEGGNVSINIMSKSRTVESQILTYCGHYSEFNIYSHLINTAVILNTMQHLWDRQRDRPFLVNFTFSVMQKHLVKTAIHENISLQKYVTSLVFTNFKSITTVSVMHITLVKNSFIILVINLNLMHLLEVYDGPVLGYNKLKPTLKTETSTFQCVILMLSENNLLLMEEENIIRYSERLSISQNISLKIFKDLQLPAPYCSENTCVIQIKAPEKYQVNTSVKQLIYQGKYSETCVNGGLVVDEQFSKDSYRVSQNIKICFG